MEACCSDMLGSVTHGPQEGGKGPGPLCLKQYRGTLTRGSLATAGSPQPYKELSCTQYGSSKQAEVQRILAVFTVTLSSGLPVAHHDDPTQISLTSLPLCYNH